MNILMESECVFNRLSGASFIGMIITLQLSAHSKMECRRSFALTLLMHIVPTIYIPHICNYL